MWAAYVRQHSAIQLQIDKKNMMNLWLRSLQRASADFLTEEGTTYIINVECERREAGGEE
ncbi:hypothetical protein V1520DRAFT_350179 [Lipomyces starkeyi]